MRDQSAEAAQIDHVQGDLVTRLFRLEPHLGPLEDQFRRAALPADASQAVFVTTAASAGILLTNIADLIVSGFDRASLARLWLFGAIGTLTAVVAWLLRRIERPATFDRLVLGWAVALVLVMFWFRATGSSVFNEASIVLAAFACYTVLPNGLFCRVVPAVVLTGADALRILAVSPGVAGNYPTFLAYGFAHIVGIGASVLIHTSQRRQFLAQMSEREARREITRLANTDALTGVLSRHRWFELAAIELKRSQRYRRPLALLMTDLDLFKRVNDRFGHQMGDAVLKRFAELLLQQGRSSDLVGRIGGEEFALLFPETGGAAAQEAARRIIESCRAVVLPAAAGDVTFTCSIGVTAASPADETIEQVLERADAALYQAKERGRDRLEVAFRAGDQ